MTWIGDYETEEIPEDGGCVFERDLMFGQVCYGFSGIPFELHRQASL